MCQQLVTGQIGLQLFYGQDLEAAAALSSFQAEKDFQVFIRTGLISFGSGLSDYR